MNAEVDNLPMLTRALLYAESFELGILPTTPYDDVKRALAQLPPDEARRARRKFRKAWKKALKARLKKRVPVEGQRRGKGLDKRQRKMLQGEVGTGGQPRGRHVQYRRLLVYHQIMERVDEQVNNRKHLRRSGGNADDAAL